MTQENKEIRKAFRLTEQENTLLTKLSQREGIDPSKYIRNLIKNKERAFTLSPDEADLLKTNFANLTRVGSNINQIVYHMNIKSLNGQPPIEEKEKNTLTNHLATLDQELKKTKKQIVKLVKLAE